MIRIKFTFTDGTPAQVIERPKWGTPENRALSRRMKWRLGLKG